MNQAPKTEKANAEEAAKDAAIAAVLASDDGARLYTALYDYDGRTEDGLRFKTGTLLCIVNSETDWWEAELVFDRSKRGYVPSNYIEPYELDAEVNSGFACLSSRLWRMPVAVFLYCHIDESSALLLAVSPGTNDRGT